MHSAKRVESQASQVQLEKDKPSAAQSEEKKPQDDTLKLELEDGRILILTKKTKLTKRGNKSDELIHYFDEDKQISYIIKNAGNLVKEYLGSVAFRELGVFVPGFFLALLKGDDGQTKTVLMQQLFENFIQIDSDSNADFQSAMLPAMTRLVAAAALLGDISGFCYNNRHIRIVNGVLYKIDNSRIFSHEVGGKNPDLLLIKLFDPKKCRYANISKTVEILLDNDFQRHKNIIEKFFKNFNAEKSTLFTKRIAEAYNHPFLANVKKEFTLHELKAKCNDIVFTASRFPAVMQANPERVNKHQTKTSKTVQLHQSAELEAPHQDFELYQQSGQVAASPSYQYTEYCQPAIADSRAYQEPVYVYNPVPYQNPQQYQQYQPQYQSQYPQDSRPHVADHDQPATAVSSIDTMMAEIKELSKNVKNLEQQLQGIQQIMQQTILPLIQTIQKLLPQDESNKPKEIKRNEPQPGQSSQPNQQQMGQQTEQLNQSQTSQQPGQQNQQQTSQQPKQPNQPKTSQQPDQKVKQQQRKTCRVTKKDDTEFTVERGEVNQSTVPATLFFYPAHTRRAEPPKKVPAHSVSHRAHNKGKQHA